MLAVSWFVLLTSNSDLHSSLSHKHIFMLLHHFHPRVGKQFSLHRHRAYNNCFDCHLKASLASWIAVETHIYQVNQTQFWARLRSRNELSVVHWPVFSPLLLPEFQRHLSMWTLKGNLKRNKREAISEINTKSWNVFQFSCQLQNISNKEWWHISENKLGEYCRCAALILWLLV